ncbi:MAG: SIS domain-containing protein [Candidatus Aminicenantes bacterium RBG_16_63_16]|nr:MAG: SIS domain-containing protein [Candidatus Aminicenantes bacterium RBG_16_63_16]
MSAHVYFNRIQEILEKVKTQEAKNIQAAARIMAASVRRGGRIYTYGTGHSVIPVLDLYPRYGSFVGFYPLYDPRLMWWNVIGPGGARELLWLERKEGYAEIFLQSYSLESRDCLIAFSHGGTNAAAIEVAGAARKKGLKIITVSSHANHAVSKPRHSSGKFLSALADVAIDNGTPPEDALVDVGQREKVAAGSTVAAVAIAMSLVAETAALLAKKGKVPPTFVSPNVQGIPKDHLDKVYQAFSEFYYARSWKPGRRAKKA